MEGNNVREVCQEHSGMKEKIKSHEKDVTALKKTTDDQWKRLDDHSLYAKDWEKISNHGEVVAAMKKDWPKISTQGEAIAGMKRDIKIVMLLLVCILAGVVKLAFWR